MRQYRVGDTVEFEYNNQFYTGVILKGHVNTFEIKSGVEVMTVHRDFILKLLTEAPK